MLYHNDSDAGNWVKVKLQGTNSNRDAFGTKLKLVASDLNNDGVVNVPDLLIIIDSWGECY